MKKQMTAIIMNLLLILSMTACNSTTSDSGAEKDYSENETVTEEDEISVSRSDLPEDVLAAAGTNHLLAVKEDGTVYISGDEYDNCSCLEDVSEWTDIIAVSAYGENSSHHVVGLKSDGTVVAAGNNDSGQCSVENWTDIISICAGRDFTAGIKSDGTVCATITMQEEVEDWTDIKDVDAYSSELIGLKSEGTIECDVNSDEGSTMSTWEDIEAIDVGESCITGLKSDGTVVVAVNKYMNTESFEAAARWNDIIAVEGVKWNVIGIKEDGTVTGSRDYSKYTPYVEGIDDYLNWENIVSVIGYYSGYVGLTEYGTLVSCGISDDNANDFSEWTGIRTGAVTVTDNRSDTETPEEAVSIINEGDIDSVHWKLDSEGVLTISGDGNVTVQTIYPWESLSDYVQKIVIEEGVEHIAGGSLTGFKELTEVTIPSTVTSLGSGPFWNCDKLETITVAAGNMTYCTIDDVLFSKDEQTIVFYPNAKDGDVYEIPDGTIVVGESAFSSCDSLTEIVLPDSVTTIETDAFAGCSIEMITIPNSVISIRSGAFSSCQQLTEITFLGNAPNIASGAFYHVKATAYYPADDDTWDHEVMEDRANYNGYLDWIEY